MRLGPGVAPLHDSAKLNAPAPPAPLSNGATRLQPVTYRALLADVLNSVLAQALANPSGASMMAMFGVRLEWFLEWRLYMLAEVAVHRWLPLAHNEVEAGLNGSRETGGCGQLDCAGPYNLPHMFPGGFSSRCSAL